MSSLLTAEELKEFLFYEPSTGEFKWRKSTRKGFEGKTAGSLTLTGYVQILFRKKGYKAHRLAWLYMTGEWPVEEVDHINGDRQDNSWPNLREATRSLNCRNRTSTRNTSGIAGVSWFTRGGNWVVQITTSDNVRIRKRFDSLLDACSFRRSEELRHGYTERHGAVI